MSDKEEFFEPLHYLPEILSGFEIKDLNVKKDILDRIKNIFEAAFFNLVETFGNTVNFALINNLNDLSNVTVKINFGNNFLRNKKDFDKVYIHFVNMSLMMSKWFIESTKLLIRIHRVNVSEQGVSCVFNISYKKRKGYSVNSFFKNNDLEYNILNIEGYKKERRLLESILNERKKIKYSSIPSSDFIPDNIHNITPDIFIADAIKGDKKNYLFDGLNIPGIILWGTEITNIHKSLAHKINIIPLLEIVEDAAIEEKNQELNLVEVNFLHNI